MTRDTYSIAVKSTYGELKDGTKFEIFKNPKTDSGNFKKSQKGCCAVFKDVMVILFTKMDICILTQRNLAITF